MDDRANDKYYSGYYYDILYRDNGECVSCFSKYNIVAHHIIGYRESVIESRNKNAIIILCRRCHGREHNSPATIVTDELLKNIGFPFELKWMMYEINSNSKEKKLLVTYDQMNILGVRS